MGLFLIELLTNPALNEVLATEFKGGVEFLVVDVLRVQHPTAPRGRLKHHGEDDLALDDGLLDQLLDHGDLFGRVRRSQDGGQRGRLRFDGGLLRLSWHFFSFG
jgi:hypothetical protein